MLPLCHCLRVYGKLSVAAPSIQLNFAKQAVMNLDILMRLSCRKMYVFHLLSSFVSFPFEFIDITGNKLQIKLTAVVLIILRQTLRCRWILLVFHFKWKPHIAAKLLYYFVTLLLYVYIIGFE